MVLVESSLDLSPAMPCLNDFGGVGCEWTFESEKYESTCRHIVGV